MFQHFDVDFPFEWRLGRLQGILSAFEWFNDWANHGHTFELRRLDGFDEKAINGHFAAFADSVRLQRLQPWQKPVADSLNRWLYCYLTDGHVRYPSETHERVEFRAEFPQSREDYRIELAEGIALELDTVLTPQAVWQVLCHPIHFYENVWDDIVFVGMHGVYLLHLGVSD
jgi:hypothetical protein